MTATTRLLVLTDFYYPAYRAGGPPRSIRAALLSATELDRVVICRDHDHLEPAPFPEPHVGTTQVDDIEVEYQSVRWTAQLGNLRTIARRLRWCDVLWLNSLHSIRYTVLPLIMLLVLTPRKSVMIAPRGELAVNALAHHTLRKRVWRWALSLVKITERVLWIASGDNERSDIRRQFPVAPVFTLPGRTLLAGEPLMRKQLGEPVQLLFLGRIVPIKGLEEGLEVLRRVRSRLHFTLAGTVEDEKYLQRLTKIAQELPRNVTVEWIGSVASDQVPALIRRHDALLFPTRGESFGHAIAETFALGRPVFAPRTTPWSFAASSGALVPLDLRTPEESAARVDAFCRSSEEMIHSIQTAAHEIGVSGLGGDVNLPDAVQTAMGIRHGKSRQSGCPPTYP